MDKNLKKAFLPAAIAAGFLMFLGVIGTGSHTAQADVDSGARLLADYGVNLEDCDNPLFPAEEGDYIIFDEGDSPQNWRDDDFDLDGDHEALQLEVGESAVLCIEPGPAAGTVPSIRRPRRMG